MKRKYLFAIATPQASLRPPSTGSFAPPRMRLRLPVRMGGLGLLTLALSLPHAHAEAKTWNGSESGTWGTGENWTPAGLPAAGDTLTFDATGANFDTLVLSDGNRTVTNLTFAGGNS